MPSLMVGNSYGEAKVRLLLATRPKNGPPHALREINATVYLTGDFARTYVTGDNKNLVPTDTIKNVVYHVAGEAHKGHEAWATKGGKNPSITPTLEEFSVAIGNKFIDLYPQIQSVDVTLEEPRLLKHAATDVTATASEQKEFGGCFIPTSGEEKRVVKANVCRGGTTTLTASLRNVRLIRTLPTSFKNFHKDQFTPPQLTNGDGSDVGALEVLMDLDYDFYSNPPVDGSVDYVESIYKPIRNAAVATFSSHFPSHSVQHTLLAVSKAGMHAVEEIKEVRASIRFNIHRVHKKENGLEVIVPNHGPEAFARSQVKRTHVEIPNPFVWSEQFDCKDDLINKQHAAMFDLIRNLDADRTNGKILAEILAHAKEHFDDEEKIFAEAGYPKIKKDSHARIHARFLKQAVDATKGFGTPQKPVNDKVILFLKKWLVEHIMGSDMQYVSFLERRAKMKKDGAKSKL